MNLFAPTFKDAYKIGHKDQYAQGTEVVYSNLTARSGKHSNVPDSKGVIWIGIQLVIKDVLIDAWNDTFFNKPKDEVLTYYKRRVSNTLGYSVSVEHMADLHDLGYLPVEIRSLPEGSFVPYKIPMMTIKNTLSEFYWVTNMLETMISAETWGMINSATTYNEYRKNFVKYAKSTGGSLDFVPFQAHDFSLRGMFGIDAGAKSGFAALAAGSFGTDTLPSIEIAEKYYGADSDKELVGVSVNATEHSVMCSNGQGDEIGTFKRLMNETYPGGLLSIVSDTWDFWQVVTEFLPALKSDIMARNGKVVIRPDSGDPVAILCGTGGDDLGNGVYRTFSSDPANHNTTYKDVSEWESKGLIDCLWDTFGGTINDLGFKELDTHIGAIYGDAITLDRQVEILERLKSKGFSSSNVVLGVGSYSYQMVTRDTHGMAIKATYVEIDGKGVEIFKDPKTDDGIKKSAKGLLMVKSWNDGKMLELRDQVTKLESTKGALDLIFKDGVLLKEVTLQEVRTRVASYDDMVILGG